MQNNLFSQYADTISELDLTKINSSEQIPDSLQLGRDGSLSTYYIPFDRINHGARVVLVGITPGWTQWKNAMQEAQRQLRAGATLEAAQLAAKQTGAFSGSMRPNLVALLDAIGLPNWLGLDSATALFSTRTELVHTTSILRHPVFVNGDNYNGTPNMTRTPFLQQQLLEHFASEVAQLPQAVFVPLGPTVSAGLEWLAERGAVEPSRVLHGLPHPSGANAERIAYFVGNKARSALSVKTDPERLDRARVMLRKQVQQLTAG